MQYGVNMLFKSVILICYLNVINSEIKLEKLSDISPKYNQEFNSYILTDKMIGLQNYLKYALHLGENSTIPKTAYEATMYNYSFQYPWNTDVRETGFGALRYNIAFASYAIASTGAIYTPAFPEYTANDLRAAVGRFVKPIVWSYWSLKKICGTPWKKICEIYNYSMCDISNLFGKAKCPDPVYKDNVMYSGHLAQIMTLYESFSKEYSLSTKGWSFYNEQYKIRKMKPSKYNLKKLISTITSQNIQSPISAFSCEPTIIYTVCNQHSVLGIILYDAIHNTNFSKLGDKLKFFNWIRLNGTHLSKNNKTINPSNISLRESFYIGATQQNIEKLITFFPNIRNILRKIIKNRDGLLGLDG